MNVSHLLMSIMNSKYSEISSHWNKASNFQLLVVKGVNNKKAFLMNFYSELCSVVLASAEASSSLQAGDAETMQGENNAFSSAIHTSSVYSLVF